ncbi:hypothetical protein BJY04DRAFT_37417 [Aspergillus karnatakaensis]|uniref:ribonuclease P Rpr2/Rpp21/SNM1 subunit n=1 Tax=Aspergillus karnatakaensis TaxID=1810916 RepID=UPI003CCD40BA
MHIKEHTPRLNFLKVSASALSSSSPSTAAFLISAHNSILLEEQKPPNQRLHDSFCGACGSPRQSEWTKTTSIKTKSQKRATSSFADGASVHKCMRCRRRTFTPGRISSRAISTAVPIARSQTSTATATPVLDQKPASKATDNASSKKRAKARKQGGLQALLAAKQSQPKASQSLDLFDFLQQ